MPHRTNGGRQAWSSASAQETMILPRRSSERPGLLGQARNALRDLISAHPIEALAGGVGLGVLLGWLLKRR